MPYLQVYYHVVWSTQQRRDAIRGEFEAELFASILVAAQRLGATVHAIGGTTDHLHVVLSIPPAIAVASAIGQLKGVSAHLANRRSDVAGRFAWERGYGLFTLGPRQLARAVAYVKGQKEHHAQATTISALEHSTD